MGGAGVDGGEGAGDGLETAASAAQVVVPEQEERWRQRC